MSVATSFLNCPTCGGHRLHTTDTVKQKRTGRETRVRVCTGCERRSPFEFSEHPGLACPKCFHVRHKVVYTRYRPGATVRLKECRKCRYRFRSIERFESFRPPPAAA